MKRAPFPFWRFSLRIYRAPGVAEACLALQDGCGADVNVLLYCCWVGMGGRRLNARTMRRTLAAVARWQGEIVRPLRHARREIRRISAGMPGEWTGHLRKRIGAAELDAEYVEQCILAALAEAMPLTRGQEPRAAVAANLERYCDALGISIGRLEKRHLAALADACFLEVSSHPA